MALERDTSKVQTVVATSAYAGNVAAKTYPWMIIVVDFFVFATVFGICVAYMTIAGRCVAPSLENMPACMCFAGFPYNLDHAFGGI